MALAPGAPMVEDHYGPSAPDPVPAPPPDTAPPSPSPSRRREVLLVGAAVFGGATLMMAVLMSRSVPASEARPAAAVPAPAAPAATPDARPDAATPEWSSTNAALWLGARRRGVAFEVRAQNILSAWMKTVQPVLVVRCSAGTIETFVVTDTAAQLEADTEDHTVTFRFDGHGETRERWPDSRDHDALFAPDAAGFARRLLQAGTLDFGFTPHNAARVTARFNVTGLEPLLRPAAKACGLSERPAGGR